MIVLKNTKLMPITKVKNITKNFDLGKFLHLVFSHALNRAAGDLGVMKGNLGVPFIYATGETWSIHKQPCLETNFLYRDETRFS